MNGSGKAKPPSLRPCWATVCPTPLGHVGIAASAHGLLGSSIPRSSPEQAKEALIRSLDRPALRRRYCQPRWLPCEGGLPPHLAAAREACRDYAGGAHDVFRRLQLDLRPHAPFTAAVLRTVHAIPAGQTMSYGEVAAAAGSPGGARAVGQVMARNPLAPVVPCHRVLGAGGKLGGYSGGTDRKAELLRIEGIRPPADRAVQRPARTEP